MSIQDELRKLPSVDHVLQRDETETWIDRYGRDVVVDAIREALDALRQVILDGGTFDAEADVLERVRQRLEAIVQPTLVPVINATGVVLHTNLGRAPLAADVLEAMRRVGEGYSNLEFDLEAGRRGSRYVHAEALLCRLTGAEAALVVNNNAGAVLLTLIALARGREVIISRGQLIEIGGGFRIPDVMAQSGARLVEVGTTNRTYVRDFEAGISEETAALMRAHASNFRISGFSYQPELADLVELARRRDLVVIDDLGSGTLIDTAAYGLIHEPTIQDSVAAGVDIVTFSGDKLLGGPQAGIIVGKAEYVARLRRHPLTRALRVDKTTLAGIQTNLLHYLTGDIDEIPIWRMIAMPPARIAERARRVMDALADHAAALDLVEGRSMVGGGSLPEESLPTWLVAIESEDATRLAAHLRASDPPIVPRIQDERVVLDLRTVLPTQEETVIQTLRDLL